MADFLKLRDPTSNAEVLLNVLAGSFRDELEWQGDPPRRSFAGVMLSTQRDPRHTYTMQVEFLTPTALEDFIEFIASEIDVFTGRPLGYRDLFVLSTSGSVLQGARRGKGPVLATVELGQMVPEDHVVVSPGLTELQRITQRWVVDLTIREAQ